MIDEQWIMNEEQLKMTNKWWTWTKNDDHKQWLMNDEEWMMNNEKWKINHRIELTQDNER